MVPISAEPSGNVQTVPQLRSIAAGMAGRSVDLYHDLASRTGQLGNARTKEALEDICAILRDERSAAAELPEAEPPDVFRDEDLGSTRLATPYSAYSLAVRNQERAFAFWTYVSAQSPDAAVRAEAEMLARGELGRIKALRAARREAYHASRPPTFSAEALRNASLEDLKRQAAAMESTLAALHRRVGEALAEIPDRRASVVTKLAEEEEERATVLDAGVRVEPKAEPLPEEPEALVGLAIERLEAAVELYLAAADASRSEEVVAAAQDLADRGIRRLSLLR